MEELKIERLIEQNNITITLTENELERAYRIKERRYLEEDFANALADAAQDPDTRFHTGHLEEFPELTNWLCLCFDDFYDANISHNDLMELTLNHLQHASLEPEFFISLAKTAPAVCMGTEKNVEDCEQNCGQYYRCCNIAEADDRSWQWGTLAALLSMHRSRRCTCCKDEGTEECPAAKYLAGAWDISAFFHSEDRKEAV